MNDTVRRSILEQLARGELSADAAERQLAVLDREETQSTEPLTPTPPVAPTRPVPPVPPTAMVPPISPEAMTPPEPPSPSGAPGWRDPRDPRAPRDLHDPGDPRDAPDPADFDLAAGRAGVSAVLNGSELIEVVGDDSATEARIDGPADVAERDGGGLVGNMGDEAVMVVPRQVDLDVTINSSDGIICAIDGTLRATFNVGTAQVTGFLPRGESRIEANCGDLIISFAPGADVVVVQRCAGSLSADDGFIKSGRGERTLGTGAARLEITGNIGDIILNSR